MTEAQVNGTGDRYIDNVDPDDPEYQKEMRRPAEIKEDVRQMEGRKRVDAILNSQAFREELEAIIDSQLRAGPHPASLIALQQISELLIPSNKTGSSVKGPGNAGFTGPVVPICDIRGVGSLNFSKAEKILRSKLAACYRLVDLYGWSQGIYNHITARISQDTEHFLINPFGLMYHEITASSLLKVDMRGEILDPGTTTMGINKAGFTIHSAIHAARPDIKAVLHLHTHAATAVSCMKDGLLPISQEAVICGDISYHEYCGIVVDQEERESLGRDLGPSNKIMFLRNHGVIVCGTSIEEAFYYTMNIMAACETQIRLAPLGLDNVSRISEEARRKVLDMVASGAGGVDMKSESGRKWRVGELEYEALMRMLDNAGYRTGYPYHQPIARVDPNKDKKTDVEYPPVASSFQYGEDEATMSPLKMALERKKQNVRAEWLATPNKYTKTEFEETGTDKPKKVTKWALEKEKNGNWELQSGDGTDGPTSSTSVKVDNKNQFAPQGVNPKELKEHQKKVRRDYYTDKITAGPQSRILEGVTWEEAQRMKDGTLSGTGDNVIVVGAASKGIIQRDHQHNAMVFRATYATNPFENMSDQDIKAYERDIQRKQHGEPEEEVQPAATITLESAPQTMELAPEPSEFHYRMSPGASPHAEDPGPDTSEVWQRSPGPPKPARHTYETNIDDVMTPPKSQQQSRTLPSRTQSARSPRDEKLVQELKARTLERSKSEKGEETADTLDKSATLRSNESAVSEGRSSREGSPVKELNADSGSPDKDKKKEKKKKLRMPSFAGKKKDKKK